MKAISASSKSARMPMCASSPDRSLPARSAISAVRRRPATRTYTVEVEVSNPDLSIPDGMTAEVILRGQPVLSTPVPRSVVALSDDGEIGVRTVNDENEVVFHPIDIVDDSTGGAYPGRHTRRRSGDRGGQNFVGDGDKVNPVEADRETIQKLIDEATTGAV
jgi:multidrug efflux system membrane fusion protein